MAYNSAGYGAGTLDHYDHPRNVGDVENPDAEALVSNPACGDTLKLTLRIAGGRIVDARFRATGCVGLIAASSAATELIRGSTLAEAGACTDRKIAGHLGGLPPAKMHGAALAESAIRRALESMTAEGKR